MFALAIALGAIISDYVFFQGVPPCVLPSKEITEFDKIAFQLLADMNKYLISLATLLLGSLGALGLKFHTLKSAVDRAHATTTLSIAGIFGITSLYFAFDSHVGLAEAAINDCTDFGTKLAVKQLLQFSALVIGLVANLYLIYRFLGYERATKE